MTAAEVFITVTEVLALPATAALTWVGMRVAALLERKRHGSNIANVTVRVDHVVCAVVRELEQRAVGVLRSVSKDARLGDPVKAMLRKAALANVKRHLGDRELANLAKALRLKLGARADANVPSAGVDDVRLDEFLTRRIEAAVHGLARQRQLAHVHAARREAASRVAVTKATKRI